jgi:tetratricopeptide (TPR) repeat protein
LTALSSALYHLGDAGEQAAITEAIELLAAVPPGPELVAAYAELAGTHLVHNAFQDAVIAADRALALAVELHAPEDARALGFRGAALAYGGDPAGLDDMRTALRMAVDQGHGRTAAVLYNNLAETTWLNEGPEAALAVCREGADFSGRRGITELAHSIKVMAAWFLAEAGHAEQALAEAEVVADVLQSEGDISFIVARAVQLRLLAELGVHDVAPETDTLVDAAREVGTPTYVAIAFAAAARLVLARGQSDQARRLLVELDQISGRGDDAYHAACLPELVRCALFVDDPPLAERLVGGVEPITQLADHALAVCRPQLSEAAGAYAESVNLYAEAAERCRKFGNVPERAYSLLGQGRCLAALGKPDPAEPLREARELFASMGYTPALAETDALLGEGEAAVV